MITKDVPYLDLDYHWRLTLCWLKLPLEIYPIITSTITRGLPYHDLVCTWPAPSPAYSSAGHFSPQSVTTLTPVTPPQSVTPVHQPSQEGIGTMNSSEPEPPGQCVLARLMKGHVVWTLAPCARQAAFLCLRSAAPAGKTFICLCHRKGEWLWGSDK